MPNVFSIVYVGVDGELHKKRYYMDQIIEIKYELADENLDQLIADQQAWRKLLEEEKQASGDKTKI